MTRAEAQASYDAAGTVVAFAAKHNMSRSRAHVLLKRLKVTMQRRGGWHGNQWSPAALAANRERRLQRLRIGLPLKQGREAKARRVYCAEQARPCVMHDFGDCDVCRAAAKAERYGAMTSTFEAEGLRR